VNNDKFYTSDLTLAIYLAYNNIRFASTYDKSSKSWVFCDSDKCKELEMSLRNGEAMVEVIKYESLRRNLIGMAKDRCG